MARYELTPFNFYFLDKVGNEIEAREILCFSKSESLRIATRLLAESNDGELFKIKTRKK